MKAENEKFNNFFQNNDNNSNNIEEKSHKNDKTSDSVTTITNLEMLEDYFLMKKKNQKDPSTSNQENSVDKSLFSTITKSSHSSNITFGSSKTNLQVATHYLVFQIKEKRTSCYLQNQNYAHNLFP